MNKNVFTYSSRDKDPLSYFSPALKTMHGIMETII